MYTIVVELTLENLCQTKCWQRASDLSLRRPISISRWIRWVRPCVRLLECVLLVTAHVECIHSVLRCIFWISHRSVRLPMWIYNTRQHSLQHTLHNTLRQHCKNARFVETKRMHSYTCDCRCASRDPCIRVWEWPLECLWRASRVHFIV